MILSLLLWACADRTVLEDANNYEFSSEITTGTLPAATKTDLTIDWSGLTVDLLGRTMAPEHEVNELSIGILALTQEEVLETLVSGVLLQSDVVAGASCKPPDGATTAKLTDFAFLSNPVVPAEHVIEGQGTWLLSAYTDGDAGARMLTFFEPLDGGPTDPLLLTSDSASLSYEVDLFAGDPVELKGMELDWSDLTVDMRGLALRLSEIDALSIAYFEEDLEELEAGFLDLESLADRTFETRLSGVVRYDLSTLTDEDGVPFEGVTEDGVWLVGLRCSLCSNPAPPFLAQLR